LLRYPEAAVRVHRSPPCAQHFGNDAECVRVAKPLWRRGSSPDVHGTPERLLGPRLKPPSLAGVFEGCAQPRSALPCGALVQLDGPAAGPG